ncbi:hypothetical protein AVEN_162639-1 [Araneus ventricosus]|uniref:Uncharacterized protein n=1 Tax=Araneus ventricosus TaxID=182803 RepID=A0A4Y2FC66_ARAVE|nr:hypothetical protein AVEN_162639-1 [Araneus ventricosus]
MAVRNVRISLRNFHPLSLSVIDFSPAAHTFFVGWRKRRVFLEFRQCQLSLSFLRRGGEFPLSLKEELGRAHILRSLYSNGLRNKRVNVHEAPNMADLQRNRVSSLEPSGPEAET